MAYTSKYKGKEIDDLLDIVAKGGGGEGGVKEDGYYPAMSVGMADELVGRGDVQDAYINFRPSGGVNKNIKDGAARVKAIKGNSVVWNQQLQLHSYRDWQSSTLTIEGQSIILTPRAIQRYCTIVYSIDFNATHKYLVAFNLSLQSNKTFVDEFYAGYIATPTIWLPKLTADQVNSLKNTPMTIAQIVNIDSERTSIAFGLYEAMYEQATVIFDSDDSVIVDSPTIIDLTQMFGAGNEPTTYEEYLQRKPMNIADEYAYEAGTLYSTKVDALKSVGDNAYNTKSAPKSARVIGGLAYEITLDGEYVTPEMATVSFDYEDIDKEDIEVVPNENNEYIFPENGEIYVDGYNEGAIVCVCIKHSYPKHSQFYEESTKDLSWIAKIPYGDGLFFPNGMRSAGSAYDEIRYNPTKKKWEAVKRIGETKVGNLSWDYIGVAASYPYGSIYTTLPQKKYGANNVLNERYPLRRGFDKNHSIFGNESGNTIYIVDSDYTDATIFKNEMADAIIYYELAEPVVVELDYPTEETNMDYRVWDFGTEEAITSEPSAPFRAGIEYGFNATDDIRSLLERVAQLEVRLTQLTNE